VLTETAQPRVLSPELVLVDGELAAWARLRLQEDAVAAAVAAPAPAPAVEAPALPAAAAVETSESYLQDRSLVPLALATVAAAAIIAGVSVALRPSTHSSPQFTGASGPVPSAAVPFAWPHVRGAHRYVFTLSRGDEVIYRAGTGAERLALKRSWTYQGRSFKLTRGRYRWRVTALGSGPSSRARVVVSAPFSIGANG
jgi:hypothetical protein